MKKIITITFITLVLSFSIMAGENEKQTALDVKAGISDFGKISFLLDGDPYRQNLKIALFSDLRYCFTLDTSMGIELGAYLGLFDDPFIFDFPFRILYRYGRKSTYIEAFSGIYVSTVKETTGLEVGFRASLWGFYLDLSFIRGSSSSYLATGLGYSLNNIIRF